MSRLQKHVVLIGLPGAGKSTVGRLVAKILNVDVRDVDSAVERRAGMKIAEIFDSQGEAAFRALERRETEDALEGDPAVVIPGGGWAAQPGNLETVRGRAVTVYLKTEAATAAKRAGAHSGRPLLDSPDPVGRMESLLAERSRYYEGCDLVLATEGKSAEQVARELAELARSGREE